MASIERVIDKDTYQIRCFQHTEGGHWKPMEGKSRKVLRKLPARHIFYGPFVLSVEGLLSKRTQILIEGRVKEEKALTQQSLTPRIPPHDTSTSYLLRAFSVACRRAIVKEDTNADNL